ncbi:MAG: hypothetical protein ACK4S4_15685 [Pyrinomonadaceae bacterium]
MKDDLRYLKDELNDGIVVRYVVVSIDFVSLGYSDRLTSHDQIARAKEHKWFDTKEEAVEWMKNQRHIHQAYILERCDKVIV